MDLRLISPARHSHSNTTARYAYITEGRFPRSTMAGRRIAGNAAEQASSCVWVEEVMIFSFSGQFPLHKGSAWIRL